MSLSIKENSSLEKNNTLALPATARYYIELTHVEQVTELMAFAEQQGIPFLVIGGGSNIVFSDNYAGLIIKNALMGITFDERGDDVFVTAAAGENWHQLVQVCLREGYYGLENLSLIPGSVGAAPIQNIGAYGVELRDCFESLTGWNCIDNEWQTLSKDDCHFSYRDSIFKQALKNQFIITSVVLKLSKKPNVKINYAALKDALTNSGIAEPSPIEVAEAVIAIRNSKLPNPDESPNVGSFFKNPIVDIQKANDLLAQYPGLVTYAVSDKKVKLAAGWLLEQAGWKGRREGDVGMHDKQSLVMINYGQAVGADVISLASAVELDIQHKFGVQLEIEPVVY